MDHDIVINEDGTIQFVYDDELAAVFDGEEQTTTRASHVEPAGDLCPHCGTVARRFADCAHAHVTRGWLADMRPSGGPVLVDADGEGFKTRAAALAAEREWLRKEKGL